jgi:hypothetical protein
MVNRTQMAAMSRDEIFIWFSRIISTYGDYSPKGQLRQPQSIKFSDPQSAVMSGLDAPAAVCDSTAMRIPVKRVDISPCINRQNSLFYP